MKQHILFGLTARARMHFGRMAASAKLNPVCFAERNAALIGGTCHSLPVLDFAEALARHPDADIHITSEFPIKAAAQQFLSLRKVPRARIANYEEAEYAVGCFQPRGFFTIYSRNLMPCTEERIFEHSLPYAGNRHRETLDAYFAYAEGLVDAMRRRRRFCCSGCPQVVKEWLPKNIKIRQIGYGVGYRCNCDCVYCARKVSERGERMGAAVRKWQDEFDHGGFFEELRRSPLYDDKTTEIFLGPGEISIHPRKTELLDAVEGMSATVASNCINYDDKIARLAANPRNRLFVSLDAGTPATYARIKNRDVFDETVNNLRRYRQKGANLHLKYIAIEQNCGAADLEGFLKIAGELRPVGVDVSRDAFLPREGVTEEMTAFRAKLVAGAEDMDIPCVAYF